MMNKNKYEYRESKSTLLIISSVVFLLSSIFPFVKKILIVVYDYFAGLSIFNIIFILGSALCVVVGYLRLDDQSKTTSNKMVRRLKARKKKLEATLALNITLCLLFLAISIYCMIENLEIGVTLFAGVLFSSFCLE